MTSRPFRLHSFTASGWILPSQNLGHPVPLAFLCPSKYIPCLSKTKSPSYFSRIWIPVLCSLTCRIASWASPWCPRAGVTACLPFSCPPPPTLGQGPACGPLWLFSHYLFLSQKGCPSRSEPSGCPPSFTQIQTPATSLRAEWWLLQCCTVAPPQCFTTLLLKSRRGVPGMVQRVKNQSVSMLV